MSNDEFRFSVNKRLGKVSFDEFDRTAKSLVDLVSLARANAVVERSTSVEVLTCEDRDTYNWSTVTFWHEDTEERLSQRESYSLDALTEEVWRRSLSISICIRDKAGPEPFMITLSCDKVAEANRMVFYGQALDYDTCDKVVQEFKKPTLRYSIGDGWSKPSTFNFIAGQAITGIRLPIPRMW
jgi:hypothetical protein